MPTAILDSGTLDSFVLGGDASLGSNPTDTIVFNNYGLQNSSVVTSNYKDSSAPRVDLISHNVPGGHGKNLTGRYFRKKIITVEGIIKKSSASALDTAMDEMKKYLNTDSGILKETRADGSVRAYECAVANFDTIFPEDKGNFITFMPYKINFECLSPFARSETREVSEEFGIVSTFSGSIENTGTEKAKTQVFIQFNSAVSVTKVNFKNTSNNDELEVTASFNVGDVLGIDSEAKEVKLNGSAVDYSGVFPELNTDVNNYTLTTTGTSYNLTLTIKFFKSYL